MLVLATGGSAASINNGSPGVYGQVLFSMHVVQHMTVATAVPAFAALGAPITPALRTLPRRTDRELAGRAKRNASRMPGPAANLVDHAATQVQDTLTQPDEESA